MEFEYEPLQEEMFEPTPEFMEQDDGSVIIPMGEEMLPEQKFDDNLALFISESKLSSLTTDLLEKVNLDKEARKKRDEQYEEGLRRTGLGDDAPGGAKFNGASKVVHPVLAESCVDFAARAIKELFPPNGPAKIESQGSLNEQEQDIATKTARCLNHQLTVRIREYRDVQEEKLTQLPLGGSQYTKYYPDFTKGRICVEFVPVDDIFIPFYATSFYEAERCTHRQNIIDSVLRERISSGQYRDVAAIKSALEPEKSNSAVANEKIEGKVSSGQNEDGTRTIYEIYTWLELEEDIFANGSRAPYIISIDEYDDAVLSIRRNWDQNDPLMNKLDWIVEDKFIPWRGAYGIGLPHLIGGLSAASTGALRALLDSAHINNAPTLLKLKGSRISGQSQQINVTQLAEIEGPTGVDDIRKYLMPLPFNPPSEVLFRLLGWLTDAAKGVVSTASEKIAEATSNTPVGTTQALIEQGAIIFSSIHARLHFNQAYGFSIIVRILKQYFPQELEPFGLNPETVSLANIRPVSDPNIFSDAQRMAQMQGALGLAKEAPDLYNLPMLHKRMLTLMKINNPEEILNPPPPQPQPMDPAQELLAFLTGQPVAVIPEQDHLNHIVIHVNYLKDPLLGKNPSLVPITAKVVQHLSEHLVQFASMRMVQAVQQQEQQVQQAQQQIQAQAQMGLQQLVMQGVPQEQAMAMLGPQIQQMQSQIPNTPAEQIMSQASNEILKQDMQFAKEAYQVLIETDQFIKDNMQAQDPNMRAVIEQSKNQRLEIERKAEVDANKQALAESREDNLRTLELLKQEQDKQTDLFNQKMELLNQQFEQFSTIMAQKVELIKNADDNKQHQMTELLKNHEDNQTALLLETLRQKSEAASLGNPQEFISELTEIIKSVQDSESENKLDGLLGRLGANKGTNDTL